MIDAGLKNLINWFSAEYPDWILTISPTFTGAGFEIRNRDDGFVARKTFLISRDYFDAGDIGENIVAWISGAISEHEKGGE